MTYLSLQSRGRLMAARAPGATTGHDVTPGAHAYLFDPVVLGSGVTLRDVFRLLDGNAVLQAVFERSFVEDFLAEFHRIEQAEAAGQPIAGDAEKTDDDGEPPLEFLRLKARCTREGPDQLSMNLDRLDVSGMSVVLPDGDSDGHVPPGGRIAYGISLTPLARLLDLPVQVAEHMDETCDDIDSRDFGQKLAEHATPELTLGNVLNSLLWELSFHGGPADVVQVAEDLRGRVEEARAHPEASVPMEDLFGDDLEVVPDLFDDMASQSPQAVRDALRELEDRAPAEPGLRERLRCELRLKPAYQALNGLQLRAALRHLRHERSPLMARVRERVAQVPGPPDGQ